MSNKQRSCLSNVNHMNIFSLTMACLLMVGFKYSDIPHHGADCLAVATALHPD